MTTSTVIIQFLFNFIFIIGVLLLIYYFMKRTIKKFMFEALQEYEKHRRETDMIAHALSIKNKYS